MQQAEASLNQSARGQAVAARAIQEAEQYYGKNPIPDAC